MLKSPVVLTTLTVPPMASLPTLLELAKSTAPAAVASP